MNELVLVESAAKWPRLRARVLDSVSSPIARRVYALALDEFIAWFEADLGGGQGRVRAIRGAAWVKVAVDGWGSGGGLDEGRVFRPGNRGDRVGAEGLTEKVVWQLLQPYAEAAGVPGIAPHDLRRSCAKLCRAAGGELEQIQLLLGHASVQMTERYLGTKQDLVHAPNDAIKLKLAV